MFEIEHRLSHGNHYHAGALGEHTAAIALQDAGYTVSYSSSGEPGDLRVINPKVLFIEVKTARRGKDRKWRFTLFKKGHTDHRRADFVMLICALKSGRAVPFVVPTEVLKKQTYAVITSHPENYNGMLARYRRRLQQIELEAQPC